MKSSSPEIAAAEAELALLSSRPRDERDDRTRVSCGCAARTRQSHSPVGSLSARPAEPEFAVECQAFPLGDFRTNDNFIFLREILQTDGEPATPEEAGTCLVQWLANTASPPGLPQPDGQLNDEFGGLGVLVIDQHVVVQTPIAIPPLMTITGVGIRGAGRLQFRGLPANSSAITFLQPASGPPCYTTIQDLTVEYDGDPAGITGIRVGRLGDIVYLRRMWLRNWDRAFVNSCGYSVIVEQCVFEDNAVHVDLDTVEPEDVDDPNNFLPFVAATATRLRECVFTGASGPAVRLNSPGMMLPITPENPSPSTVNGNSCLITGCSFTGNQYGVYVDRHQAATMIGNSFVGNSVTGVYVTSNAREARVIANFFDQGDRLEFEDADEAAQVVQHHHQWGFNTVADEANPVLLAQHERLVVEALYAATTEILPP